MSRTDAGFLPVLLSFAVLAGVPPLPAQRAPQLAPGQCVRVTSAGPKAAPYVGELVARSESALVVREDSTQTRSFELDQVRRIEVSWGVHSRVQAGATVGGIAGFVAGAALGVLAFSGDCPGDGAWLGPDCHDLRWVAYVGLAGAGLVAGGLVGGAVGALQRAEMWQTVPLKRLRQGVVALPGGRVGVGVSVAL